MKAVMLVAVAALLTAASVGAAAAPGEEMYYGRTSQGRAVALDIRGDRTAGPAGKFLFLQRHYLMLRGDTDLPLPNGVRVVGNAVHVHTKIVGRANITAEIWFDAHRTADRRAFAGSYRDVVTLQDGGKMATGLIRFTTRLWASSNGALWTGTRSDGKVMSAAVTVLPSPEGAPKYALTIPEVTVPLTCSAGETTVSLGPLRATLAPARLWPPPTHGEYMFEHGLAASALATATTPDGVVVRVNLDVSQLRWSGTHLVARGAIAVRGTGCTPASLGFTLSPA